MDKTPMTPCHACIYWRLVRDGADFVRKCVNRWGKYENMQTLPSFSCPDGRVKK